MIRPQAKAFLLRWRELILGIIIVALGAKLYITSFGLLKIASAVAIILSAIAMYIGQQRGRFRMDGVAPGIVSLIEDQISYFGPHHGGTISIANITSVNLITYEEIRSWRLDQNGKPSLIIPVAAMGGELLFDAFTKLKDINLENMVRQLSQENEHSAIIWRSNYYGINGQYLH